MANEPDNLVLVQLRDIRATQVEHSAQFAEISKRLDQLGKRFEDFRAVTSHTLTLSTANDLRMREFDQRHEFSEGAQRRMTERLDEFERRLTRVEDKIDR